MTKTHTILLSILAASILHAIPAAARTITVNCNEGMTVSGALSKLDPTESSAIRVSGVCSENITITGFAGLSIIGVTTASGPATIKPTFAVYIVGSHVQLSNLTIKDGYYGVTCRDFSICNFSGNTVENAIGDGVLLDNADATFSGDVIQNNLGRGLFLTASRARLSKVSVTGTLAGRENEGTGIEVDSGSTLTVDQITVNANSGPGIYLKGNAHLVNQYWVGPFVVSGNGDGGIAVTENSSAELSGTTVLNNSGSPGVVITGNSEASFWGGGTFTGNSAGDVYCGPLNGVAASPQSATIGVTNCPNTYQ
jgi:hypothetical protein